MSRRLIDCAECGQTKPSRGRGLCSACHQRATSHGAEMPPRTYHRAEDVIEDVDFLTFAGESDESIPARLGMTAAAIERAARRQERPDICRRFSLIACRKRRGAVVLRIEG